MTFPCRYLQCMISGAFCVLDEEVARIYRQDPASVERIARLFRAALADGSVHTNESDDCKAATFLLPGVGPVDVCANPEDYFEEGEPAHWAIFAPDASEEAHEEAQRRYRAEVIQ